MKFNLTSKPKIATNVEMYYDKHTKSWVVFKITAEGYQVGEATYVHSKGEATKEKELMMREVIK